ncbi:hypothetical protein HDU97_003980 [Phlyctochytrium planicorne]|nr:hypothetical protein HDU97_003980 [Phlyctochytrium planicorne]
MTDVPDCCKTGFLWSGTPTGQYGDFAGLPSYISEPTQPSDKYIIILADTFGHTLPNTQLIADSFAKAGFRCIIPDILDGDALSPVGMEGILETPKGFSDMLSKTYRKIKAAPTFLPWMAKHNRSKTMPFVNKALAEFETVPATFIGVVGYCFGGKYAAIAGGMKNVSAIASVHPSMLSLPSDLEEFACPGYFAFAERDTVVPLAHARQIERIRQEKDLKVEVKLFPGMNHGFAVRGEENIEEVMQRRDECLQDIVSLFNRIAEESKK